MKATKKKISIKNSFFEGFVIESQRLERKDLPITLAFWISKNFEKIRQESQTYFEMKRRIAEKYSAKDENGKPKIDSRGNYEIGNMSKFVEELRELQGQEIEIELDVIKIRLQDLDGIKMTPAEMSCLIPFIEIEE